MVGFITVNPDTIAFSAHMDWIRRLCGLLQHCIAQQYSCFPHSVTHSHTDTHKYKHHLQTKALPLMETSCVHAHLCYS